MLYGFLKGILPTMFRIIYRAEVHGEENVPKEGGAIIAANHISLWDPPFVGAFCPRRVSFMAKKELFENSVFSSIITKLGAFPVNRGAADRNAIKTALSVLSEGKCLGLFPEGTRSKDGDSFVYSFAPDESCVYFAHNILYHPDRFFEFAKNRQSMIKECQACVWNSVCKGGCIGDGMSEQSLYLPDRQCSLRRLVLRQNIMKRRTLQSDSI